MKPCPGCSAPLRLDSSFCTKCGFRHDDQATVIGKIGESLPTGQFAAGALIDGKYRVERILGEGGMGMVYLAKSIHTEIEVVIKAVRPEIAHRADIRERTLAEGKALARIDHPNVVQLKSVVVTGDELILVMQYIEGENLEDRIVRHTQNQQPMTLGEILAIFRQILAGVSAAHAEGVIHRDIKPANILIRAKDDVVKVTDFGIAKPEEDAQSGRGQTQGIIGTVNYMSPEQVTGRRDLDRRVDIYALGIMLYEMLTGVLPFDADNTYEILRMHVDDPLPSATVGRAHLPALLDGVLQKACAKEREHRYASCEEFSAALEGMETALSSTAQTALPGGGVEQTIPGAPSMTPAQQQALGSPQRTPSAIAAAQFVEAVVQGHAPQPSAPNPVTQIAPYGSAAPGYGGANTAQRPGTITGQAAELPASRTAGGSRAADGKGWVVPLVLASLLAGAITVALVVSSGSLGGDDETSFSDDDPARRPRKKKKRSKSAAGPNASASAPEAPLAKLVGQWESKSSGNKFNAVLIGDRLEFQIVDAVAFRSQNYIAGEPRFVLRVSDTVENQFLVEDRVRPYAPSSAPGGFSPQSRATCIAAWHEVGGEPLLADLSGNRLDVDVALVKLQPSVFDVVGGKVRSCRGVRNGVASKPDVRIGLDKLDP